MDWADCVKFCQGVNITICLAIPNESHSKIISGKFENNKLEVLGRSKILKSVADIFPCYLEVDT
jgi:hypothetical protein